MISQMLVNQLVQLCNNEYIKAPHCLCEWNTPLISEFLLIKEQWCGTCFHVMTFSWSAVVFKVRLCFQYARPHEPRAHVASNKLHGIWPPTALTIKQLLHGVADKAHLIGLINRTWKTEFTMIDAWQTLVIPTHCFPGPWPNQFSCARDSECASWAGAVAGRGIQAPVAS